MLEREKVCSSAAIPTALAVSSENQIDSDGVASALEKSNGYTSSPEGIYALPRIDLHEVEWIESDLVDAEVSRLVSGSSATTTTATRNNPRRCCRTSTSSGYSSHSPPLSAGSYSCYASAAPGNFRTSVPLAIRDPSNGGLAVIHEGETIPRPIWPSAFSSSRDFCHGDDPTFEYDGLYACSGCGYTYSYCDWDYGQSTATSAQEVLLELSRTLNSVIEGETTMTPEEILRNISLTVAQSIGLKKSGLYEYTYHTPFWLTRNSLINNKVPSSSSSRSSTNRVKSSRVNPVNSRLYSGPRHLYAHNSPWSTARCTCKNQRFQSPFKGENLSKFEKKDDSSVMISLPQCQRFADQKSREACDKTPDSCTCKCFDALNPRVVGEENICAKRHVISKSERTIVESNEEARAKQKDLGSNEPEYTMQLESSDGGSSSSEGIVTSSSSKSSWDQQTRGFAGDFDFTLDVTRAERLGRAIAKAKRKRQWCRALTALFGLVFFVLSVVVVSLSVTRGRKVFGSM